MITENTKARLLDGAVVAAKIKQEVQAEIEALVQASGVRPCLAAVRVGDDPASAVYVRNKIKACEEVGIASEHHALPESIGTAELLRVIKSLNERDEVHGILTQLPLPRDVDETAIIEAIDPSKDVDGFHPVNAGRLAMGRPVFVPCTPAGIIELLDYNEIEIRGTNACVV
ncbi:MAG TPA: bifunctional 5,10-methylenetetrahydrofolate dehydrogenase/5,10-methenyltetrahydrofolate cyclohydrolase, partial [Pyrinomonadaceae bacterium]|nr:bifunctional 5,10-methylenetetrahydrofolate dehydrogenase/5,10-methenyltetrahydrofolate cyclohydrolase [Pyrinomonadaceae bacterium]